MHILVNIIPLISVAFAVTPIVYLMLCFPLKQHIQLLCLNYTVVYCTKGGEFFFIYFFYLFSVVFLVEICLTQGCTNFTCYGSSHYSEISPKQQRMKNCSHRSHFLSKQLFCQAMQQICVTKIYRFPLSRKMSNSFRND